MSLNDTRAPESVSSSSGALLADDTRVGAVHLTVSRLDSSIAFYQDVIGLRLHRRADPVAAMGAGGEDLVVLYEQPTARRAGRHAGLYHFALLSPTREELARAAVRLASSGAGIDGASDHGTHEAIYLSDPDGNGIELAADRPRDQWRDYASSAGYAAGPAPLDLESLLASVHGEPPRRHADAQLKMGHVHLHVGELDAATSFYRDGLGFEVMAKLPSAVFVSAGGYHHHVGFNVWRGIGVGPAPDDAVGLRHWTLEVVDDAELEALRARLERLGVAVGEEGGDLLARDPSGTAVRVTVQSPA